jgi:hypothetical protein
MTGPALIEPRDGILGIFLRELGRVRIHGVDQELNGRLAAARLEPREVPRNDDPRVEAPSARAWSSSAVVR